MALNIQIVSDLHVEFWAHKKKFNFIKPSAPILALLGDTCCLGSDEDYLLYKRFLDEQIPHFDHILLISGNHEYYYNSTNIKLVTKNNTMKACDKKLKEICKTNAKLHYLNNSTMKLKNNGKPYLIIGSVLWSWIPPEQRKAIQEKMNDYKYIYVKDNKTKHIRNITSDEIVNLHVKNRRYIQKQINKAKKQNMKALVLTHHKPYLSKNYNPESCDVAYESDLTNLIKSPVVTWCYGHTHVKDNRKINGVNLISNPKGYPRQQTKYNNSFTISI